MSRTTMRPGRVPRTRLGRGINIVLFIFGLGVLGIVAIFFSTQDGLRVKFDATHTRAYSLSAQTTQLLDSLDEDWTIALVLIESQIARSERTQIDEVLHRYTEATDRINVERIDPTSPSDLAAYDGLLARLQDIYAAPLAQYEVVLDEGEEAYTQLRRFAQEQSGQLASALARVPQTHPAFDALQRRHAAVALLASQGQLLLDEVRKARIVTDARPLPDHEGARSILAAALGQWANELADFSQLFESWADDSEMDQSVRSLAAANGPLYLRRAGALAQIADDLKRLPELELSRIGHQLGTGEGAILLGPDRAAIIPRNQLLPRVTRRGSDNMDRRFRGEQVLSATIRSLTVPVMPMVVFAHAEPQSLFQRAEGNEDLVSMATLLAVTRFDVREWRIGEGKAPEPAPGQQVVWIVVSSIRSMQKVDLTQPQQQLLAKSRELIRGGASVLLSYQPSPLPKFQRDDPWVTLTTPFGVRPTTGQVIFERYDLNGEEQIGYGQVLSEFESEHPICAAVHGQQTFFLLPMPLDVEATPNVVCTTIASVDSNGNRWLETDLLTPLEELDDPSDDEMLSTSMPIALAVEHRDPTRDIDQRCIIVGSAGWMLSRIADQAESINGGQVAMSYPGNQELMLASVAWLAGMDELIAPSPISQQVSRLTNVTSGAWVSWFLASAIGAPLCCVLLGGIIWTVRRI